MDPSSLLEWRETPGTTFWMLSSLVMTVATSQHWGGLRMTKVNFHQRSVMKDREYWRAVTSALTFEKPNWLQVIIVLVMMFSLASQLERRLFRGRALTFVINLALIAVSLHLPGFYMKDLRMQFTSSVFAIAVTTWYALEFYNRPVALLTGILSIPAITLPFLMVGVRYFAEGSDVDRLRLNLVGVAAGVFMKAICANPQAAVRLRQERQQQAKQREEAATKANPNPKGEGADKPKDT